MDLGFCDLSHDGCTTVCLTNRLHSYSHTEAGDLWGSVTRRTRLLEHDDDLAEGAAVELDSSREIV